MKNTKQPTNWEVIDVTSRLVVWTGLATSKDHALAQALSDLERTRVPACWHAMEVAS